MTPIPIRLLRFLPALLLAVSSSWALQQDPENRWPYEQENGRYQAKLASNGKVLWSVKWETRVSEEGGVPRIEIKEQGEGQPLRYEEPILWEKKMLFQMDPSLQVESVRGTRWTQDGEVLSRMDVQAHPETGKILYQDAEGSRSSRSAVLPWSPQALPDELLFHWARTLPFERELQEKEEPGSECLLLVSPKHRFRIRAQIEGRETVTTPAGTFSCYRVSLKPQLLGPLKALAPRMRLWCKAEPPHYWVRYEGPVGGPGSPRAVIELVEFREGQRRE